MKQLATAVVACTVVARCCLAEIEIKEPSRPVGPATSAVSVVPPQPVAAGTDGDLLKFRNGDQLHGVILSATPAGGVRWSRGDVKTPLAFELGNVAELTLAPRGTAGAVHRLLAELTNGDTLAGDLVALNEKALTLKTWYAGTLSIKRSVLQRLAFLSQVTSALYTGPNSLDEWKSDGNRGAWTFKKGALTSAGSGSIGRDVKLPDVASIEFDLAWRGPLSFSAGFGFDDVRQVYNSGGYFVQMNYTSIYLQRNRPQQGSRPVGANFDMQELQRKTKMHVAIRADKSKKVVALYFDGTLAKQWAETEDWAARGTSLVLMSQGQGQLRVSNISVTTWDGRLDVDPAASAKETDLVRLTNGDKVSGSVKSITGGQVALVTSFAEMAVPLERIGSIDFANQKTERARRNADDVRACFPDGKCLTLALEKLDEQGLAGTTENCGRIVVTPGAFRRVQFHIYEKPADNSDDDEWGAPVNPAVDQGDD